MFFSWEVWDSFYLLYVTPCTQNKNKIKWILSPLGKKIRVGPDLIFLPDAGYSAISGKARRIIRPDIRHPAKKIRSVPTLIFFSRGLKIYFIFFILDRIEKSNLIHPLKQLACSQISRFSHMKAVLLSLFPCRWQNLQFLFFPSPTPTIQWPIQS